MSYRAKLDANSARFSQLSTQTSCVSASRSDSSEACGAVAVDTRVDLDTKKLLVQRLLGHPVLGYLGSDDMQGLINALQYYEIGPNEWLYEVGSPSRQLYFLNTGTVRLRSKSKEELVVRSCSVFGDQALFSSLRSESASTLDATTFWSLSPEAVQLYTSKLRTAHFQRAKNTLLACGFDFYLSMSELNAMAGELLPCKFKHGDKILAQDELGDVVFFLSKGAVSVIRNGNMLRVMSEGEFFGEQAVLYGGVRTANVEALEKVECFAIEKAALFHSLGSSFDQVMFKNSIAIALDTSPTLASISDNAKASLSTSMKIKCWDSTVIPAGTVKGEHLWIVLNGVLGTESGNRWTHYAAIGDEYIRKEELSGEAYQHDVNPETEKVVLAEIGRWEFFESLGFATTTFDSSKVRLLQDFSSDARTRLLAQVQIQTFSNGEVLVSEHCPSPYVHVIKNGIAHLSHEGRPIKLLSKFDSVGERSLFMKNSLWVTAIAYGEVEVWTFDACALAEDISQLTKYDLTHEAESENLTLDELLCVEPLGSGQFGSVFFAVTPKPASYALKCISKRRIDSGNLQHDVINEKQVLQRVNHQMVVKLHRTFRDEDNVYFLLEHVNGMLFFDVLLQLGQCTDMMTKFYMGCLVLIFEHLSERGIVYRDLKPENIMVDSGGFLKLIDFGSAKRVIGRTCTVIGTPQYMAPEMILGKAYTAAVDMWSLGVLLYELICNGVPFGEGQEDTYLVFQQVLSAPLSFPTFVDDDSLTCSLIALLLVRDPKDRATLEDVKRHDFMAGVIYESIRTRNCSPPYIPKAKDRSKAIRLARQHPKTWAEAVEEEGMNEELDLPVKRPGAAPGPDWDQDF